MPFSSQSSISINEITNKISEFQILSYYLGVPEIPYIMNSPLRVDNKPSFGLYSKDRKRIFYIDFSTGDKGGVIDLLSSLWNTKYEKTLMRIYSDIPKILEKSDVKLISKKRITTTIESSKKVDLQCKIRNWKDYDLEYWKSYGISLEWLKYAEIYPISHKIVIKNGKRYVFNADKYAYVYVEHKENKTTLKVYQPFNKDGYKWSNKNDKSVIGLWTKVPKTGNKICICSSVKDALCLWSNTGIPSIAIQGEGYSISNTAINELKKRYKKIYILLDNDKAGLKDAIKLEASTGFINIILPKFEGGKDISDLMKIKGKQEFTKIILPLFNVKNHIF